MNAVGLKMNLDPWRIMDTWTWWRFWWTVEYLNDRAKEDREHARRERVRAGIEKPKLVDWLREGHMGGGFR